MAKTYTPVGWEDGEIISPAMANLTTGEVTPAQVSGTTPVNAENLNKMDQAIKDLYDEVTTSKDIVIGTEEETTEDTKLLIEKDSLNSLGTEVADSLDGNETDKAPNVKIVKEKINGFVLYENYNGTNSNFELYDDVSNYNYFEIYYTERKKRHFGFIKVPKEFINEIPLSVVFNDNTYMYIVNIVLKLNNKNATFTNSTKRMALNTTTSVFQDSEIYVFKIIGYK